MDAFKRTGRGVGGPGGGGREGGRKEKEREKKKTGRSFHRFVPVKLAAAVVHDGGKFTAITLLHHIGAK